MKQEMTGWQWHQVDHMQIIRTVLQSDNHSSTLSLNYLQAICSFWRPTNSVKALKAITTAMTVIHKYERRFTHNNTVYIHHFVKNLNSILNFSDDNATCDVFLVLWITWSFHIMGHILHLGCDKLSDGFIVVWMNSSLPATFCKLSVGAKCAIINCLAWHCQKSQSDTVHLPGVWLRATGTKLLSSCDLKRTQPFTISLSLAITDINSTTLRTYHCKNNKKWINKKQT